MTVLENRAIRQQLINEYFNDIYSGFQERHVYKRITSMMIERISNDMDTAEATRINIIKRLTDK